MRAEMPLSGSRGWMPPRARTERNYPMNCWWVAAFCDEVGEKLLGRWLLDTPVLLYRTANGQAIAIENRCPHRSAPLSLGSRQGDAVQCGYHGFTFGPDGRCIRVPSMKSPPAGISVRAFPVIESFPFVWVYLGDPQRLDAAPAPHRLEWAQDAAFAIRYGRMDIAANFMLLKENVLDLTHFGYVHASTFKITDWIDPPQVVTDGDTVTFRQSFIESPLPPVFAEPLGLAPGTPFNRDNYGSFVSPALQIAAVDFRDPRQAQAECPAGRLHVIHATTPIDATHMHYFWVLGRDHGTSDEQMDALKGLTEQGFVEDQHIIEAVQEMLSRDPRPADSLQVSVRADTAAVQARRALQRWMDRETA